MWGLTKQEQRIILFLLSTFAVGSIVRWHRQQQAAPPVDPQMLAEFEERSAAAFPETTAVVRGFIPAQDTAVWPLDLNRATLQELQQLPGIGAVMAQRIVDYRKARGRFGSPEELQQVKGIGRKTFEKLKPLVVAK